MAVLKIIIESFLEERYYFFILKKLQSNQIQIDKGFTEYFWK